jgi:hypothetical protein
VLVFVHNHFVKRIRSSPLGSVIAALWFRSALIFGLIENKKPVNATRTCMISQGDAFIDPPDHERWTSVDRCAQRVDPSQHEYALHFDVSMLARAARVPDLPEMADEAHRIDLQAA